MEALWNEKKEVELAPGCIIVLRHVGTASNPLRFSRLNAEWARFLEQSHADARRELLAAHGTPEAALAAMWVAKDGDFSSLVSWWATKQDAYLDALSKRARDLIVEGTAGGERSYEDAFNAGGEQLLFKAMGLVYAFNTVSADQGKG